MDEFDLIDELIRPHVHHRADVILGIGDDAALLAAPTDGQLVVAVDTLVAGVHFPEQLSAFDIGVRAAVVNLSDFAAMGAEPRWATLALTLPQVEPQWVGEFMRGLAQTLSAAQVALVGGDTTRGPLTITLQLMGVAPAGMALTRSGARPGDAVFVSGTLGDAAGGLELLMTAPPADAQQRFLVERFAQPTPRLALGRRLRGLASSCIDISDGLLADLGHLCTMSGCGADLRWEALPVSAALVQGFGLERARTLAASGGDDYELCFTAAPARIGEIGRLAAECGCPITRIGVMAGDPGITVKDANDRRREFAKRGFTHFPAVSPAPSKRS